MAVNWSFVQRVLASPGTLRQAVDEVVTFDVVQLALCRSSLPPNVPVAAQSAKGTATASAATAPRASNFLLVNKRAIRASFRPTAVLLLRRAPEDKATAAGQLAAA
jgi:hypothetical protein